MLIKYYTKEEALAAVSKNGSALYEVTSALKDDYDVVLTAIKNGGYLNNASVRLQNDPTLVIEDLKNQFETQDLYSDGYTRYSCDYPRAMFCAKRSKEMLHFLSDRYSDWDEFIIELKLHYGESYTAPISQYNTMAQEELLSSLNNCRKQLFLSCRNIYNKAISLDDLERIKSRSKAVRHQILRWQITGYDEYKKPFSSVVDSLSSFVHKLEEEKHQQAHTTGGSFPERFVSSVLNLLSVDYSREQIFSWSKSPPNGTKRYDFYISSKNTIIEVHGAQHYDGGFESRGGRTLKEEQENDQIKETLALENGIENYIIINATSSSFDFIKSSILQNHKFCKLFDMAHFNWSDMHTELSKTECPIETPLIDETITYYKMLISLFQDNFKKSDFLPPKATTVKLAQQYSSASSANTLPLSIQEIALLTKIEGYDTNNIPDWVRNYCYVHFGISNIDIPIQNLIDQELITLCNIDRLLQKTNVPLLKKALSDKGLPTIGVKSDIIERIKSNLTTEEIIASIPTRYYVLTESGIVFFQEYGFLLKVGDYDLSVDEAYKLYEANIDYIHQKLSAFRKRFSPFDIPSSLIVETYHSDLCSLLRGFKINAIRNNASPQDTPQTSSTNKTESMPSAKIDTAKNLPKNTQQKATSVSVISEPTYVSQTIQAAPQQNTTPPPATTEENHILYAAPEKIDIVVTKVLPQPKLPRKGFVVPAIVVFVLTVMFFFVSFSQPNMWFGFGCFGILSGMFFALAYSPKEAPCLFGMKCGIPKKYFVIVCSIAAFLMPILSNYFE